MLNPFRRRLGLSWSQIEIKVDLNVMLQILDGGQFVCRSIVVEGRNSTLSWVSRFVRKANIPRTGSRGSNKTASQ